MLFRNKNKALRVAQWVAIVLGVAHFILMMCFQNGPELAPLVVDFVDYPGFGFASLFMLLGIGTNAAAVVAIIFCSFLYPLVLYYLFKLVWMLVSQSHADAP